LFAILFRQHTTTYKTNAQSLQLIIGFKKREAAHQVLHRLFLAPIQFFSLGHLTDY
jgi:hypothetical protein